MKKTRSRNIKVVLGIAWYRREQWLLLKSASVDADEMHDSYDEWVDSAEKAFSCMRKEEKNVLKVVVDVEELIDWCRKENCPVDSSARARFVNHKLKDRKKSNR